MKTEIERVCEIMETLLAHQPIIDVPYETINDIAIALVQEGYGDISEYKAEIERLKAENEKLLDSIESVQAGRCRLRCPLTEQAVKEFAERLKKYLHTEDFDTPDERWKPESEFCAIIDELIKEIRAQ